MNNVSGVYNGLQTKIRAIESRVLFVHCQAHSPNLVTQHFMKNVIEVRLILQLTRELIIFIVESSIRIAWFKTLQQKRENYIVVHDGHCDTHRNVHRVRLCLKHENEGKKSYKTGLIRISGSFSSESLMQNI